MKLSKLKELCGHISKLTEDDPEIEFQIDGCSVDFEGALLEEEAKFNTDRGNPEVFPGWQAKLTMNFVGQDSGAG